MFCLVRAAVNGPNASVSVSLRSRRRRAWPDAGHGTRLFPGPKVGCVRGHVAAVPPSVRQVDAQGQNHHSAGSTQEQPVSRAVAAVLQRSAHPAGSRRTLRREHRYGEQPRSRPGSRGRCRRGGTRGLERRPAGAGCFRSTPGTATSSASMSGKPRSWWNCSTSACRCSRGTPQ